MKLLLNLVSRVKRGIAVKKQLDIVRCQYWDVFEDKVAGILRFCEEGKDSIEIDVSSVSHLFSSFHHRLFWSERLRGLIKSVNCDFYGEKIEIKYKTLLPGHSKRSIHGVKYGSL